MAIKERKCLSCATVYKYCPDCSRTDKLAPSWKAQFCSESCAILWTILTKFGMNYLTKSEAKGAISSLDLNPIDHYVACVRRDYAKVMEPDRKYKRGKRIGIKPVDDVAEVGPEIVEPIAVEPKEEIKEFFEDKAATETCLKVSEEKQVHEVVIKKENE